MNSHFLLVLVLVTAGILSAPGASAQSIGRFKKSIDKATGGATSSTSSGQSVSGVSGPTSAAQAQAQAAAADSLARKRNQKSQVGVDQRVIDFLKQRIEDGSADAAFDLGKRYEEGKGVEADPSEAWRLYALSAERGNEDAKTWLETHPKPAELEKREKLEKLEKSEKDIPVDKAAAVPASSSKPVEK